ncbi:MAG: nicotinamide-nucleotide amidohydrolase family protein [Oscillospiraceae bacterium]|nr:nicotinamide-nucleotide amidohydrolase family protein [Oscillospiraceae bacterium]
MKADVNGLNDEVVKLLAAKKMTISAAESCTGGLFAALITDVPGASYVLNESFVTYANSAKMKYLDVKEDTLDKYSAVSRETAYEMALGLQKRTGADVTVGITGIAGPDGGTKEKPVGLVYAGICAGGTVEVLEMHHGGTRAEVREKTCREVFIHIKNRISDL